LAFAWRGCIDLFQHGVGYIRTERAFHGSQIGFVPIGRELHQMREAAGEILNKLPRIASAPSANQEGHNELTVRVDGC
jgi:hypothetical protein